MAKGVAITGRGIVCAIGTNCKSVLSSLREHNSGISTMRYLDSTHLELPVGEVKMSNDEMKAFLGLDLNMDISRTSLMGAIALRQAIVEANLSEQDLTGKRIVFISGTTVGGMDVTERHYARMCNDAEAAHYVTQHDCGSNSNEIARLCGLYCPVTTISTACSSALNAIILGTRMLLADEADIIIAGGAEALSRFHLNGFNSLMILDHDVCRPFDKTRCGLNLGEGASYIVLEQSSGALDRGITPIAYVGGYGNHCDAFHQTATSENGGGAYLAMKEALSIANIEPGAIDYVNAHGTGTPDNDRSESSALKRLFGDHVPPVSSTKSYTGHTTSASGSIETTICTLALEENFIPVNLGWREHDENCVCPYMDDINHHLHLIMCNSFGFGGNDSSLIISDKEIALPEIKANEISVLGEAEIDDEESLKDLKQFVSPIETRRMSKMMKAALLSTLRVLNESGINKPDAIIIATQYGMLDQGEKILEHITECGEDGISPTLFMQSTHNTIAGNLAIRFKCHGYNITYSQGADSLSWAIKDAKLLISEGKASNVLVGIHDQCPDKFRNIFNIAGVAEPQALYSKSMLISKI